MARCDACGAEIDVGARFCGECGAIVRAKTKEFAGGRSKGNTAKAKQQRDALRETKKGGAPPAPAAATAKTEPPPPDPKATDPKAADPKTTLKGLPAGGGTEPPPKPAPPDSGPGRSEFQRLLEEVETGFDAILVEPESIPPPKPADADDGPDLPTAENVFDQGQAEKLFQELVVANAEPIRDFMIEIRLGEPHADWITYCEPAVRAILRSAEGMGHAELVTRLRTFLGTLTAASEALATASGAAPDATADRTARAIRGEKREKIIDAYSELIVFFPEAFALEAEANAREAAIVGALLTKVKALHKVGLDRILSTGLASLGLFYVSRPQDIVELAGVAVDVAEEVAQRFREYRTTVSQLSPQGARAEERRALREACGAVLSACRAYEAAGQGTAERRRHRRARSLALADVALFLARLGEVERLKRIEVLPFAARCADVLAFLDEAEKKERRQE